MMLNVYTYSIYMTILVVSIYAANSEKSIELKDEDSIKLKTVMPMIRLGSKSGRSVSRFARHDLCRHRTGQVHFYNILKSKICDMNQWFVESFVTELCDKKGKLLELWAGALFDFDADGFVSDLESSFYNRQHV